jgi:hypothetical protein
LEKLSRYIETIGKDFVQCGGVDIAAAVDQINPETDINGFIATNRTGNPIMQREEF